MEGFLRFLGWLFLIFLAYLILGFDENKWKKRIQKLKAEYKNANEEYVRRFREDKKLELRAMRLSQVSLLGFYVILFIPFFTICSYYEISVIQTFIAAFGTYMLFASPVSHILFGRDMGAASLYKFFNGKIRTHLNKRNNFNAALLPIYLKKREKKREELLSAIKENRK